MSRSWCREKKRTLSIPDAISPLKNIKNIKEKIRKNGFFQDRIFMKIVKIKQLRLFLMMASLIIILSFPCRMASAGDNSDDHRYGLGLITGKTYDPVHNIDFYLLSGCILYDYEKIWHHKAPDALRFKVEYEIGVARKQRALLMSSLNMFALYYLNSSYVYSIRPYVEGGIGVIYTDFQVKGQGLKFNFNPQMGIGTEFKTASREIYFLSLRLHHISNGGLIKENRGINSVLVMLGRYF
jgi:lipid A 3-O-deacylase